MILDFVCDECGIKDEHFVKDREQTVLCEVCSEKMRPLYPTFGIDIDFKPGFDIGLGKHIETKKQRENIMAEKGLRRIKCG